VFTERPNILFNRRTETIDATNDTLVFVYHTHGIYAALGMCILQVPKSPPLKLACSVLQDAGPLGETYGVVHKGGVQLLSYLIFLIDTGSTNSCNT
jgi:hypothetical protein